MDERSGPGSRGGQITVRRQVPPGMPADRWARIVAAVYTPEVKSALERQSRGDTLSVDDRQALLEANDLISSEVKRWEDGEPFDPDNPDESDAPTIGPPQGRPDQTQSARSIDDALMPPADPSSTVTRLPEGRPDQFESARQIDDALMPPAAPGRPAPPPPPPPPPVPPRSQPPVSRTAMNGTTGVASLAPPAHTEPPFRPQPPVDMPPSFASDPEGAVQDQGPLSQAITRAGGRPTSRVTDQVAREIGQIVPGGYQGRTGGWRTMAQGAAAAWEQQYHDDPGSLAPSERRAYERDPHSLYDTILDADSPFRDYRESWIGAYRAGQAVPMAQDVDRQLRGHDGYASPFGDRDPSADTTAPPTPSPSLADEHALDDLANPPDQPPPTSDGLTAGGNSDDARPTLDDTIGDIPKLGLPEDWAPDDQMPPVEPDPTDDGGDQGWMDDTSGDGDGGGDQPASDDEEAYSSGDDDDDDDDWEYA